MWTNTELEERVRALGYTPDIERRSGSAGRYVIYSMKPTGPSGVRKVVHFKHAHEPAVEDWVRAQEIDRGVEVTQE